MISQFLSWYLIVQLITLASLPLALSLFRHLPGRGYVFSKTLGILLTSLFLWLGTAYGLLRNEAGGAWVALVLVAAIGLIAARTLRKKHPTQDGGHWSWRQFARAKLPSLRYVLTSEVLFLLAFAAWAYVRAHDPAVDHTEQPMDLMFMNGIWHSPNYPPRDPWMAGYAISYYYFGYWMLTTLARLAGLTPAVAYNVGQACWFGLLLLGTFGIGYNLVALATTRPSEGSHDVNAGHGSAGGTAHSPAAYVAGFLSSIAVGLTGNLQGLLEWLYANGYNIERLTDWLKIYNFPQNASVTNDPLIGAAWWWWRSARVIEDQDLAGNHIEVIDEFPMFSYVLGDNHPHVLAMPFAILAIAMALNFLLSRERRGQVSAGGQGIRQGLSGRLLNAIPLGGFGLFLMVVMAGAMIFLNTWDFPPYFLLMVLCGFTVLWRTSGLFAGNRYDDAVGQYASIEEASKPAPMAENGPGDVAEDVAKVSDSDGRLSLGGAFLGMVILGVILVVGSLVLYLPYFMTAQSQAGGILPNLFYPTRFPQFLVMFGGILPATVVLIWIAWRERAPDASKLITSAALVYGLPILWLVASVVGANSFGPAKTALERVFLPPDSGYADHTAAILDRWSSQSLTFLALALLLSVITSLVWTRLADMRIRTEDIDADAVVTVPLSQSPQSIATFFTLLLAAIGLLLAYAPEFVYLRDNFGTRMNTVFKFYYQSWLLLGLSGSYALVRVWGVWQETSARKTVSKKSEASEIEYETATYSYGLLPRLISMVPILLIVSGLIYPIAGASSKTNGFSAEPTFDATQYVANFGPNEYAAIEWIRENTPPTALVLEGKGQSYRANFNRISTMTGRATLMGWEGHQSQWRGPAFAEMASGRSEAIGRVYQSSSPLEIAQTLQGWEIDYVYVGPAERDTYQITTRQHEQLEQAMDLVFESGDVRVYARRS